MKIAIIGYSGAGKSYLADRLGQIYGCPVLHLDRIQFLENWVERNREEGRAIVTQFMDENAAWVIDGNYQKFYQARRLEEADQIIFMNFPRAVCLMCALQRYVKNRNSTRPDMAAGCMEKFDWTFAKWILHDGRTKNLKKHYRDIVGMHMDKTRVFRSRIEVKRFLKHLW